MRNRRDEKERRSTADATSPVGRARRQHETRLTPTSAHCMTVGDRSRNHTVALKNRWTERRTIEQTLRGGRINAGRYIKTDCSRQPHAETARTHALWDGHVRTYTQTYTRPRTRTHSVTHVQTVVHAPTH